MYIRMTKLKRKKKKRTTLNTGNEAEKSDYFYIAGDNVEFYNYSLIVF